MDIAAIFLLLAVMLAVGLYLYAPFMQRHARPESVEGHELSSLLAERDRLINAVQELDFDHSLGKIPEQDYPAQRAELLQRGADVLRKLDGLARTPGPVPGPDERLETAVAAPSDDDLESMLAARRKARGERSAGFCPRCGKPVLASDRFCPNCGKSLTR